MTEKQIALVKSSWKLYRSIDPVIVGDVFYSKLFADTPYLKSMFNIPKDEQSKKLVDMLSLVVGRLDRLDELTEDIRQLALRHKGYGVKISHYDQVGVALLWTLKQGLGNDWNEEVGEAWRLCYQKLSGAMKEAAY
jgi:hemoglobin-like flavoprotein